jgi:hypothetical protein
LICRFLKTPNLFLNLGSVILNSLHKNMRLVESSRQQMDFFLQLFEALPDIVERFAPHMRRPFVLAGVNDDLRFQLLPFTVLVVHLAAPNQLWAFLPDSRKDPDNRGQ